MKRETATLHFTELLLSLLKGSTGLVDALHILSRDGIEKDVRESAVELLLIMKRGRGFSDSLRAIKNGRVFFNPLYSTLITAAELTGNIQSVLERILNDLQRKQKARDNVLSILLYPAAIVFIAIAGTILIIVKGLPFFIQGGFLSGDVLQNAITGILVAGTVLLSGGGTLFFFYFKIFYFDSPEFRIFYLLDFLVKSNIPLVDALAQCIVSIGNTKYSAALVSVKKDISSGVPFSTAFAKTKLFSPYVLGWLSVADTQGDIALICGNISGYYAGKDSKHRELASRLIEPAVIIVTGIYLLIIMLTVILPILTYAGGVI
ncbi:MAG: type II secretion system F family protein [Treponema sp.]|jgi:type II secretory pathway component PulF|nr:type II secretion system F family protein [Treponema sp.]